MASYKPKPWNWNQGMLSKLLAQPPEPQPFQAPTQDPVALNYADPSYIGALAQSNLPFQQAIARLPGDVGALASNYGYTTNFTPGSVDPATGLASDPNVEVTGIDASNPYSRAALLQRSYDQAKAGNTTSYAARGQLYSGALGNAQNAAQTNFNMSSNQLRGSFNDIVHGWLAGLDTSRLGAQAGQTTALGNLAAQGAANPGPTTYGGVPYQPGANGGPLTPLPGAQPTAASVLASGSLAGTGAAGSGKYKPRFPTDTGYKPPRRR